MNIWLQMCTRDDKTALHRHLRFHRTLGTPVEQAQQNVEQSVQTTVRKGSLRKVKRAQDFAYKEEGHEE